MTTKANILLVGSGGVGTMSAYNMEIGSLASVTTVLRYNYDAVNKNGFTISSVDHGEISGWKPTTVLSSIPDISKPGSRPFDFIVVTTKNIPDITPTVSEIIAPAVTPGHTAILLVQNGLNIENPFIASFPSNPILSGVAMIGAAETSSGQILHNESETLIISAFYNQHIPLKTSTLAGQPFVSIYSSSGKIKCEYTESVGLVRWRKLVYNACYNSACTITGMDTSRLRLAGFPLVEVVRPLMREVVEIASVKGFELGGEEIVEFMINADPEETFFRPKMLQDIEKGNYIEYENIVGEPLREAEKPGIPAPNLRMIYGLLKVLQHKTRERKGLVKYPVAPPFVI